MKSILISFIIVWLMILTPLKADAYSEKEIYLREDLILQLLAPQISKELDQHFGSVTQYNCAQITKINKVEPGSYLFTVDVQVVTFNGPHNPPYYVVNMTFSNSAPGWMWRTVKFKSYLLDPNKKMPCRDPL